MNKYYCGIDLHSRNFNICIVDSSGKVVKEAKFKNSQKEEFLKTIREFSPEISFVVESTYNWYWLVDLLQDESYEVKLAHPLYLKAIAYAKVKTDKVDPKTLAQLFRVGMLPEAYIYPRESRSIRDLLRRRATLVGMRTKLLTSLNFTLAQNNVNGYTRNSIKKIASCEFEELFSERFTILNAQIIKQLIDDLDRHISLLEKEVLSVAKLEERFDLLMTAPGIGPILSLMILYEIGDIDRFPNEAKFCSYSRVVPGISQSNMNAKRSSNSKQGNPYLKFAFSQAACIAIKCYPSIRRYYQRLLKKKNKSVAKAIIAHKLAIAVYFILKRRTPYDHSKAFGGSEELS